MGNVGANSIPRALVFSGAALLSVLSLAGCADERETLAAEDLGEAAQAIEGGYGDQADRAVVGLAVTDSDGHIKHTCSGALIAPNLVLTAQHCIAPTDRFVHCTESRFGPPVPPERVYVTPDASMWGGGTDWSPVAEVLPAPGSKSVCGHDVALLRLNTQVPGEVTPLVPRLHQAVMPGETYSAVGFGASGEDAEDAGQRRRRDHLEVVCVGQSCGSAAQVDEREWLGDHGICNGDSGGPALDAAGRVIGVTSRGPLGCDDPIYGGITEFKDWIREEAIAAARAGNYVAAPWTRAETDASAPRVRGEGAGAGSASCALRAIGAPGAARGGVLLALAALALRHRRASAGRRAKGGA